MISKLRHDAALYVPYDGPYAGRGKRKKYGKKLEYHHMPAELMRPYELLVVDRFWDARREWHLHSPW